MADPLVKRFSVPMLVFTNGYDSEEVIRVIETGWKGIYSVIREDAYQSKECGHEFMNIDEIEDKYKVSVDRLFKM